MIPLVHAKPAGLLYTPSQSVTFEEESKTYSTMHLKSGTFLQGGKYRIEEILGHGGFGITYLAVQVGLNRKVAVKEFFMKEHCNRDEASSYVSVPSLGSQSLVEKFRAKFIKEAQTIADMDNPHIVRIYDVFEENGTAYYVMEHLSCGSLVERIPSDGLPESEALGYIRQVCDALSYIHENKILHLDIKPSNILFRKADEAVLIDFGISKHYDESGGSQTSSTPVGVSRGYAPLEQYKSGGVAQFTPATDIYSLGATLYKLLTGLTPPDADEVNEEGLSGIPSSVSAPPRVAVETAMSPKRKDRPQSVEDFLELLDTPVVTVSEEETKAVDSSSEKSDSSSSAMSETSDSLSGSKTNGLSRGMKWLWGLAVVLVTVVVLYFFINRRPDMPEHKEVALTDTTITTQHLSELKDPEPVQPSESSVALEEERQNVVDRKGIPNIVYSLSGTTGGYSEDSRLCATIDGENVVIGSISYIFGPNNHGYMSIFDQTDFNGDGIKDVIVSDENPGTAGGSTWAVITYAGDNTFEKSNLISEGSYYQKEISSVNGQTVLDYIAMDLGERVVKERYGLENGNLVSLALPKSKSQAYTPLKSVNMEELGESGSFYFDLNDDGINEKVTTTGPAHFGRSFEFNMNGQDYVFYVSNAMWGVGTLHILKTKTNGFHDIMVEQDTRLVHKWDGSTYKWE